MKTTQIWFQSKTSLIENVHPKHSLESSFYFQPRRQLSVSEAPTTAPRRTRVRQEQVGRGSSLAPGVRAASDLLRGRPKDEQRRAPHLIEMSFISVFRPDQNVTEGPYLLTWPFQQIPWLLCRWWLVTGTGSVRFTLVLKCSQQSKQLQVLFLIPVQSRKTRSSESMPVAQK